ncbi:MAG TPA: vWA domain-containing protein [Candidatus Obscuribacterales bacterium]
MRKVQIAFVVDTTGSMGWLREVLKRALLARAAKLFKVFPGVEVAFIFIGDDVNPSEIYSVEVLSFTRDVNSIVRWMDQVGNSLGGGHHANYPLGLRAARQLPWAGDAVKIIEVIGDEQPQRDGFEYHDGTTCDWRFEARQLLNMGCSIDAVHCFPGIQQRTKWFYQELAKIGNGLYLTQDQFDDLELLAIGRIYTALSDDVSSSTSPIGAFERELRSAGRFTKPVAHAFATMTGRTFAPPAGNATTSHLEPVASGQLQLLVVNTTTDVTKFLNDNGFVLKGGEAVKRFYRYTGYRDGRARREKVQWYKDVILRDVITGEFFSGDHVRRLLGLPLVSQQKDFVITGDMLPQGFDVFIESTSSNRRLPAGTEMLIDQTQAPSSRKHPCRR